MALLAVTGLFIGVMNDAANFLNSAIGSKAAPVRVIMAVASVGIIVGAVTSTGMMEVARSGMFDPSRFTFRDVMILYFSVMLANIILLDVYNTMGLPTSTTVALVFCLLGAALAVSTVVITSNDEISLVEIGRYINSTRAMAILAGILLVIMILLAVNGDGDLSGSIANQAQNLSDAGSGNWLGALWSAIIYGSFQATIVANIASVAEDIPDRRESKKAAITGFLANTILLIVLCTMLFSYTNVYDITAEALPFYSLLQRLGYDWLTVVYIVIVFIAVLSTVVGFAFAGVARFSKYYQPKEGKKSSLRDAIFVGIMLIACALVSKLGIMVLVSKGYTILGYLNLPIIVLPAIILGGHKISKKYLKKNNIDATGVDM